MRQRGRAGWIVAGITWAVATFEGAEPALAKSLTLKPLGSAPAAERRVKGDIPALEAQVQADPKDRAARLALVRALVASQRLPEALDAAREWRAHDAYNLVAVRAVGDVYTEMGDRERARRAYSAVVELLPNDARAQRALVGVLKQSGDLEAAYDRLVAAAALAPSDARIAFERADTAQRLGRSDEAARLFRGVIDTPGASASLRHPAAQRLAQLLGAARREALAAGDAEDAAELLRQVESLGIAGGVANDIKVFLSWDTDRTDVDLWVTNPKGEKVYYDRKQGSLGDALYDDVTTGYGPESYSAPEAAPGTYLVQVNYYQTDRQAFAEARGEVLVILDEGTARETRRVLPYRLFEQGQTVSVAAIEVTR
jgi:tetratricopeptide (TPR) repeat protein